MPSPEQGYQLSFEAFQVTHEIPVLKSADFHESSERPEEKCNIVGMWSEDMGSDLVKALVVAGKGGQHRGQNGVGLELAGDGTRETFHYPNKYNTGKLIREALTEREQARILSFIPKPKWGLLHGRYGTSGNYSAENLQPVKFRFNGDEASIVHNGEFALTDEQRDSVGDDLPKGASDTRYFAELIRRTPGHTFEEKLLSFLDRNETVDHSLGAYSMIAGVGDALYVARDPRGIRPMVMGRFRREGDERESFIFASETHSLNKLGIATEREVGRGEVLRVDEDGLTVLREANDGSGNFCNFEEAYFSRPDSKFPPRIRPEEGQYEWNTFYSFRERCGELLAEESPIEGLSFVTGVPDSGMAFASGYAMGMRAPFRPLILRDHYDEDGDKRSFLEDHAVEQIRSKVIGKLSFVADKQTWKNAIVAVGDDSMVRSSVAKVVVQAIRDLGAKEVHVLLGFPPVKHPCHLGVSMRTPEELIAARLDGDVQKIADEIGATSVKYISSVGFNQARLGTALKLPEDRRRIFLENSGCGGCVTGLYPVNRDGSIPDHAQHFRK